MSKIQRPSWIRTRGSQNRAARSLKHKKTEHMLSLEHLKNLERSAPHFWSEGEREVLCVINRFYERSPNKFTAIFNHIFGLELSTRKVKDQFESYIRLYGGMAFKCYARVFATPINDPHGRYSECATRYIWVRVCKIDTLSASLRRIIEKSASVLNIKLRPLKHETAVTPSRGAQAKAARTRRRYKALVRRASQNRVEDINRSPFINKPKNSFYLGGYPVNFIDNLEEIELVGVEKETVSSPPAEHSPPVPSPTTVGYSIPISPSETASHMTPISSTSRHLAFRVWDSNR
jgi:hypothetical protein